MHLMSSDDANRLLRLREGTAGRTQYDGRLERTDEFLLRVLDEISAAHDRRVTELLAANTAEIERRRAAEALTERMWPIVDAVCREWLNGSRDTLADDERYFAAHLRHRVGRAAAALIREREETRL